MGGIGNTTSMIAYEIRNGKLVPFAVNLNNCSDNKASSKLVVSIFKGTDYIDQRLFYDFGYHWQVAEENLEKKCSMPSGFTLLEKPKSIDKNKFLATQTEW
jgi:hypothetical protein